ncbi:MAG: hypothetical protein LW853_00500 [Rickettsiales bacterium]|nr:hypothetical protein [Rickettsiales bacterium]
MKEPPKTKLTSATTNEGVVGNALSADEKRKLLQIKLLSTIIDDGEVRKIEVSDQGIVLHNIVYGPTETFIRFLKDANQNDQKIVYNALDEIAKIITHTLHRPDDEATEIYMDIVPGITDQGIALIFPHADNTEEILAYLRQPKTRQALLRAIDQGLDQMIEATEYHKAFGNPNGCGRA